MNRKIKKNNSDASGSDSSESTDFQTSDVHSDAKRSHKTPTNETTSNINLGAAGDEVQDHFDLTPDFDLSPDLDLSPKESREFEQLILSLELSAPSEKCEQQILNLFAAQSPNIQQQVRNPHAGFRQSENRETADAGTAITPRPATTSKTEHSTRLQQWVFATSLAIALIIGFFAGTNFSRIAVEPSTHHSAIGDPGFDRLTEIRTDTGLRPAVLIENQSSTVIIEDELLWQNDRPVRKVETLTRKQIQLPLEFRSQNISGSGDTGSIEVPIRKVLVTPAAAI